MDRRALCALTFAPALVACRSPTQIQVTIDTDVDCGIVTATSFTSGELGAIENAPPTTESAQCGGEHLGSVVLVPSADDSALVGFKVVTALNHKTLDYCGTDAGAPDKDCIVARRALRYLPHTPLDVVVKMETACEGVVCDPRSTCARGTCVAATIADPSQCVAGCGDEVLTPVDGGLAPNDGGIDATVTDAGVDATIAPDGSIDATLGDDGEPGDTSTPEDAGSDGAADAPNDAPVDAGVDTGRPPFDGGYSPPSDCDLGGTQPGAAWPQEGYCPTHRNRSPYAANTSGTVTLHGPYAVDGTPQTAPAVGADGTLVLESEANTIVAVKANGAFKWRYVDVAGDAVFYTMPVLAADGTVRAYGAAATARVYVALNPADGGVVSRVTNSANVTDGVTRVDGGIEYVVDNDSAQLQARLNGAIVWSGPGADSHVGPTVAVDRTIFVTASGALIALDPDGGQRWSTNITSPGDPLQTVAIAKDDSVRTYSYVTNEVFSYDPTTHVRRWSTTFDAGAEEINGIAIADDGTTYVGTQSSGIVRVDGTGHQGTRFGSRCNAPVIDAAGTLVAWCDETIVALSPDLTTTYWQLPLPVGGGVYAIVYDTPVIGPNGLVYFTLELGGGLPDGGDAYAIYAIGP